MEPVARGRVGEWDGYMRVDLFVISHYLLFIGHSLGGAMSIAVKANELEERLIDFAVRIIKVAEALPGTTVVNHVSQQLLRPGTSPSPNYAEARGAESNADFVHKLKITLKELNETSVWLRIARRAGLMKQERLKVLIDENQQLCKSLNGSARTAKQQRLNHKTNDKWSLTDN